MNWGEMRGAESERGSEPWTHACPPTLFRNKCPQRPSSRGPFSARAGEASRCSRRVEPRRQVRGARGSDAQGLPGVGVRVLSRVGAGGRDLPHHSFLLTSQDLRSGFPDPRGTGPGTGRRRKRYPDARCEWTASGCAVLPELCGAPTALRCAPPRDRLPEAAEGARFISAKVLLLFFVQSTSLFIGGRPGVSPGLAARTPLPASTDLLLGPTRIHLGAQGLPYGHECPGSGSRFLSI